MRQIEPAEIRQAETETCIINHVSPMAFRAILRKFITETEINEGE